MEILLVIGIQYMDFLKENNNMEENKELDLEQETEVIKALKEEYETKLAEQKASYENTLTTLRTEHAKQLRTILRSGEAPAAMEQESAEDEEDDEITAAVKRISAKYNKKK